MLRPTFVSIVRPPRVWPQARPEADVHTGEAIIATMAAKSCILEIHKSIVVIVHSNRHIRRNCGRLRYFPGKRELDKYICRGCDIVFKF